MFTFLRLNHGTCWQSAARCLVMGLVMIGAASAYADPVAKDDVVTTEMDTAVSISPLSNDYDQDGGLIYLLKFGLPKNGTLTKSKVERYALIYTPAAGFTGTDSFYYTISNGTTNADAQVFIQVTRSNTAPVAENDFAVTDPDLSVNIDVLANDSDADGDRLYLGKVTRPANGQAAAGKASVVYTPNPGFTGTDTFQYYASDLQDNSNLATVTVTVGSPPDPDPTNQDVIDEVNANETLLKQHITTAGDWFTQLDTGLLSARKGIDNNLAVSDRILSELTTNGDGHADLLAAIQANAALIDAASGQDAQRIDEVLAEMDAQQKLLTVFSKNTALDFSQLNKALSKYSAVSSAEHGQLLDLANQILTLTQKGVDLKPVLIAVQKNGSLISSAFDALNQLDLSLSKQLAVHSQSTDAAHQKLIAGQSQLNKNQQTAIDLSNQILAAVQDGSSHDAILRAIQANLTVIHEASQANEANFAEVDAALSSLIDDAKIIKIKNDEVKQKLDEKTQEVIEQQLKTKEELNQKQEETKQKVIAEQQKTKEELKQKQEEAKQKIIEEQQKSKEELKSKQKEIQDKQTQASQERQEAKQKVIEEQLKSKEELKQKQEQIEQKQTETTRKTEETKQALLEKQSESQDTLLEAVQSNAASILGASQDNQSKTSETNDLLRESTEETLDGLHDAKDKLSKATLNNLLEIQKSAGDVLSSVSETESRLNAGLLDNKTALQDAKKDLGVRLDTLQDAANEIHNKASVILGLSMDIKNAVDSLLYLRDLHSKPEIEKCLASGSPTVLLLLPASQGGQLEDVRAVLVERMGQYDALGFDVSKSLESLSKGDEHAQKNELSKAFDEYAKAYQELLKDQKEDKGKGKKN